MSSSRAAQRLQRTARHLAGLSREMLDRNHGTRSPRAVPHVSAAEVASTGDPEMAERYAAAWRILELGARGAAAQAEISPRWESETLFWYTNGCLDGTKQCVIVDCSSEPARRRLASEDEIKAYAMIDGSAHGSSGAQTGSANACSLVASIASPVGTLVAYVQDHNLWLRDTSTGEAVALSTDGTLHYDYATQLTATSEIPAVSSQPVEPALSWSPCGRYIATAILDCRNCPQLTMVHSAPPDQFRPKYYRYFYPLPGDQRVPTQTPVVFDVRQRSMVLIQTPPFPCLDIDPPWVGPTYSWCGSKLRYVTVGRGYKRVAMEEACPTTGNVCTLIEEIADPLINWVGLSYQGGMNELAYGSSFLQINGGREVLWLSERDGWAHLYLYSVSAENGMANSTCRCRQLTSGEWVVRGVVRVDESRRLLFFYGAGRELRDDPYLRRLYSISLDERDARPVLLTPECADHAVVFSPAGDVMVDRYSRADLPTVAVLRRALTGAVLLQLEVADISPLLEVGWTMPVPCCSTAADGKTLLYSLLWPPHALSPASLSSAAERSRPDGNSYGNRAPCVPVLENVYPGPHSAHTPKRFSAVACSQCAAAAALGFAVVFIDGRGTGQRSREFREHSHKNLGGGVDDHPQVIRDMAAEHPDIGMDLERVGIWGHSAGGYASAHAILKFPGFYKVAVSNAMDGVWACLLRCLFPVMVA